MAVETSSGLSPAHLARDKSGLKFFDLSHPWGHNAPLWPYFPDGTHEIVGLTQPPERDPGEHCLAHILAGPFVLVHPCRELGPEHGRRDGVDVDPMPPPLAGQGPGQPVIFLCSPAAEFITGQVLYVDGGYTAG